MSVIDAILQLSNVPDPVAYRRYLETLPTDQLDARVATLREEAVKPPTRARAPGWAIRRRRADLAAAEGRGQSGELVQTSV